MHQMKSRAECLEQYGSDYRIQQEVKAGNLYKIGRGLYAQEQDVPELATLACRYPQAVVTMHQAFYIHGLTDWIPDRYDLATERNAAKMKAGNVRQYFLPKEFFEQGIEVIESKGYPIRIYNKERMLVELLRYKSKLPYDFYKEVLLNYRRILPQLNIQRIQDYACCAPRSSAIIERLQTEVL